MSRHQDGTIWVSSDEEKLEFKDKNGDNNKDNVENNENGNKSVEDMRQGIRMVQSVLVMAMMERG